MTTDLLEPFMTLMDTNHGTLHPERAVLSRTLSDMKGMYLEEASDLPDDTLIYRVFSTPVPERNSEIQCSTTVIEAGKVGHEYFMTKGHFHEKRDRSEIYLGLAGEGRLVLATEEGDFRVQPIRKGTVNYVPGWWAHRTVNVGDGPLVFFAAYVGDAGHDYEMIESQGFPVLVVETNGVAKVVPNPRYDNERA